MVAASLNEGGSVGLIPPAVGWVSKKETRLLDLCSPLSELGSSNYLSEDGCPLAVAVIDFDAAAKVLLCQAYRNSLCLFDISPNSRLSSRPILQISLPDCPAGPNAIAVYSPRSPLFGNLQGASISTPAPVGIGTERPTSIGGREAALKSDRPDGPPPEDSQSATPTRRQPHNLQFPLPTAPADSVTSSSGENSTLVALLLEGYGLLVLDLSALQSEVAWLSLANYGIFKCLLPPPQLTSSDGGAVITTSSFALLSSDVFAILSPTGKVFVGRLPIEQLITFDLVVGGGITEELILPSAVCPNVVVRDLHEVTTPSAGPQQIESPTSSLSKIKSWFFGGQRSSNRESESDTTGPTIRPPVVLAVGSWPHGVYNGQGIETQCQSNRSNKSYDRGGASGRQSAGGLLVTYEVERPSTMEHSAGGSSGSENLKIWGRRSSSGAITELASTSILPLLRMAESQTASSDDDSDLSDSFGDEESENESDGSSDAETNSRSDSSASRGRATKNNNKNSGGNHQMSIDGSEDSFGSSGSRSGTDDNGFGTGNSDTCSLSERGKKDSRDGSELTSSLSGRDSNSSSGEDAGDGSFRSSVTAGNESRLADSRRLSSSSTPVTAKRSLRHAPASGRNQEENLNNRRSESGGGDLGTQMPGENTKSTNTRNGSDKRHLDDSNVSQNSSRRKRCRRSPVPTSDRLHTGRTPAHSRGVQQPPFADQTTSAASPVRLPLRLASSSLESGSSSSADTSAAAAADRTGYDSRSDPAARCSSRVRMAIDPDGRHVCIYRPQRRDWRRERKRRRREERSKSVTSSLLLPELASYSSDSAAGDVSGRFLLFSLEEGENQSRRPLKFELVDSWWSDLPNEDPASFGTSPKMSETNLTFNCFDGLIWASFCEGVEAVELSLTLTARVQDALEQNQGQPVFQQFGHCLSRHQNICLTTRGSGAGSCGNRGELLEEECGPDLVKDLGQILESGGHSRFQLSRFSDLSNWCRGVAEETERLDGNVSVLRQTDMLYLERIRELGMSLDSLQEIFATVRREFRVNINDARRVYRKWLIEILVGRIFLPDRTRYSEQILKEVLREADYDIIYIDRNQDNATFQSSDGLLSAFRSGLMDRGLAAVQRIAYQNKGFSIEGRVTENDAVELWEGCDGADGVFGTAVLSEWEDIVRQCDRRELKSSMEVPKIVFSRVWNRLAGVPTPPQLLSHMSAAGSSKCENINPVHNKTSDPSSCLKAMQILVQRLSSPPYPLLVRRRSLSVVTPMESLWSIWDATASLWLSQIGRACLYADMSQLLSAPKISRNAERPQRSLCPPPTPRSTALLSESLKDQLELLPADIEWTAYICSRVLSSTAVVSQVVQNMTKRSVLRSVSPAGGRDDNVEVGLVSDLQSAKWRIIGSDYRRLAASFLLDLHEMLRRAQQLSNGVTAGRGGPASTSVPQSVWAASVSFGPLGTLIEWGATGGKKVEDSDIFNQRKPQTKKSGADVGREGAICALEVFGCDLASLEEMIKRLLSSRGAEVGGVCRALGQLLTTTAVSALPPIDCWDGHISFHIAILGHLTLQAPAPQEISSTPLRCITSLAVSSFNDQLEVKTATCLYLALLCKWVLHNTYLTCQRFERVGGPVSSSADSESPVWWSTKVGTTQSGPVGLALGPTGEMKDKHLSQLWKCLESLDSTTALLRLVARVIRPPLPDGVGRAGSYVVAASLYAYQSRIVSGHSEQTDEVEAHSISLPSITMITPMSIVWALLDNMNVEATGQLADFALLFASSSGFYNYLRALSLLFSPDCLVPGALDNGEGLLNQEDSGDSNMENFSGNGRGDINDQGSRAERNAIAIVTEELFEEIQKRFTTSLKDDRFMKLFLALRTGHRDVVDQGLDALCDLAHSGDAACRAAGPRIELVVGRIAFALHAADLIFSSRTIGSRASKSRRAFHLLSSAIDCLRLFDDEITLLSISTGHKNHQEGRASHDVTSSIDDQQGSLEAAVICRRLESELTTEAFSVLQGLGEYRKAAAFLSSPSMLQANSLRLLLRLLPSVVVAVEDQRIRSDEAVAILGSLKEKTHVDYLAHVMQRLTCLLDPTNSRGKLVNQISQNLLVSQWNCLEGAALQSYMVAAVSHARIARICLIEEGIKLANSSYDRAETSTLVASLSQTLKDFQLALDFPFGMTVSFMKFLEMREQAATSICGAELFDNALAYFVDSSQPSDQFQEDEIDDYLMGFARSASEDAKLLGHHQGGSNVVEINRKVMALLNVIKDSLQNCVTRLSADSLPGDNEEDWLLIPLSYGGVKLNQPAARSSDESIGRMMAPILSIPTHHLTRLEVLAVAKMKLLSLKPFRPLEVSVIMGPVEAIAAATAALGCLDDSFWALSVWQSSLSAAIVPYISLLFAAAAGATELLEENDTAETAYRGSRMVDSAAPGHMSSAFSKRRQDAILRRPPQSAPKRLKSVDGVSPATPSTRLNGYTLPFGHRSEEPQATPVAMTEYRDGRSLGDSSTHRFGFGGMGGHHYQAGLSGGVGGGGGIQDRRALPERLWVTLMTVVDRYMKSKVEGWEELPKLVIGAVILLGPEYPEVRLSTDVMRWLTSHKCNAEIVRRLEDLV